MEIKYQMCFLIIIGLVTLKYDNSYVKSLYMLYGVFFFIRDIALYIVSLSLGLIAAPIIVNLCYLIIFRKVYQKKYGFYMEYSVLVNAITEELLFRDSIVYMLKVYELDCFSVIVCGIIFTFCFTKIHNVKGAANCDIFIYSVLLFIAAYVCPGLNHGMHIGRNWYIKMKETNQKRIIKKIGKWSFLFRYKGMDYRTPFLLDRYDNAYCVVKNGKVCAEFNYVFKERNILLCYAMKDNHSELGNIVRYIKAKEKEIHHIYVTFRNKKEELSEYGFELETVQRKNEKKEEVYYDHYVYAYNCKTGYDTLET